MTWDTSFCKINTLENGNYREFFSIPFHSIDNSIDSINSFIDSINSSIDSIDSLMDSVNSSIDSIDNSTQSMNPLSLTTVLSIVSTIIIIL